MINRIIYIILFFLFSISGHWIRLRQLHEINNTLNLCEDFPIFKIFAETIKIFRESTCHNYQRKYKINMLR